MHGEFKVKGGKLVVMDLHVLDGHLHDVRLSGDFFLEPDTALTQINAALSGQPATASAHELIAAIEASLPPDVMMFGFSAEAVAEAVLRALGRSAAA